MEVCNMSKEINIIGIVELNKNGIRIEEQENPLAFMYFNDNGSLPEGNFDETNVAGTWVVVSGKHEVGTYAYRSSDDCTLIVEEELRNYLISELKNNVDENWDLKQLVDRYNEMVQLKNKKILEEPLKKAMEEVDKEMDERGYIDDSDCVPYWFLRFLDKLARKIVERELVPDKNEEEIEYFAEKLLCMIKENMSQKYNTYSNNGRRCFYKTKEDLIYWGFNNFMPEIRYLDEQYEWFVNEFKDIEVSVEEYAKLIWGLEPEDLEDYL